jgi:cbb3-type cytochrome oxidase subunit 3
MSNPTALQIEIDQLRDERAALMERVESTKNGRRSALWAILIGIITAPFGIGIILFLIGVVAAFTQGAKHAKAKSDIGYIDERITELRQQIVVISEQSPRTETA